MARPRSTSPTETELEVLRVVWRLKTVTVRDVHDAISQDRKVASNTLSGTMERMVRNGLLRIADVRRPQRFGAVHDSEATHRQLLQNLANVVAGGSIRQLLSRALGRPSKGKVDSAEINRLLDRLKE